MKKHYQIPKSSIIELDDEAVICNSNIPYGGAGNGKPADSPSSRDSDWSEFEN